MKCLMARAGTVPALIWLLIEVVARAAVLLTLERASEIRII